MRVEISPRLGFLLPFSIGDRWGEGFPTVRHFSEKGVNLPGNDGLGSHGSMIKHPQRAAEALRGLVCCIIISHIEAAMNIRDCEILYDAPTGACAPRPLRGYAVHHIRSGAMLEVSVCPRWRMTPSARRALKEKKTSEAMQRINARNKELHIMRLIECNFSGEAFVLTPTYDYPAEDYGFVNIDDMLEYYEANHLPETDADVRRDVRNFLNKLKRRMKSPKALKWILQIEEGVKEQPFGMPNHLHAHMVIEAEGLTQDEIKALWPHGFMRCDRLDLTHKGSARLAAYFCKQKRGGRWWSHSRNLKKPVETVSYHSISHRRVAQLANDVRQYGREIFEDYYKGYSLQDAPVVRYSDYGPGCYIYARLYRKPPENGPKSPPWGLGRHPPDRDRAGKAVPRRISGGI